MATRQGLSLVRAAVQHEADHLRAEAVAIRRRLELLAKVEGTIATLSRADAIDALREWLAPPDMGARSEGSGPIPPDRVSAARASGPAEVGDELFTLEGVAAMFARLADEAPVTLDEANPAIPEADAVELLVDAPSAEGPEAAPARPSRRRRARRGELAAAVYGCLALVPGGMLPSALAARLNRKVEIVWSALLVLEHRKLVVRDGKRFVVPSAAATPTTAPPETVAPSLRIVRDGDTEFEVVPAPRPSAFLGSSIGPRSIGE